MPKDDNEKSFFKIQIPQQAIRNKSISDTGFVVYCKLLQLYYIKKGTTPILKFNHKMFMAQSDIGSNKRFKKALDELYNKNFIKTEIKEFPRKGMLEIEINEFFNIKKKGKKKEDRYYFAQLPYVVLDYPILSKIGHTGVRLLYYYESYINRTTGKEFAYPSMETIEKDTGITDKTINKYNKILHKMKFIKIVAHKLETKYEYIQKETGECLAYDRYNNHYYVRLDKIEQFYLKEESKNDDT